MASQNEAQEEVTLVIKWGLHKSQITEPKFIHSFGFLFYIYYYDIMKLFMHVDVECQNPR